MIFIRASSFRYFIKYQVFHKPVFLLAPCRRFTQDISLLSSDGYSKEEQLYLLGIINKNGGNELPSQVIGDSNSKKIKSFVEKAGPVNRLEDLLKVQGLGPRSVKKICDKLLEAKDGVTAGKTELNPSKRLQATSSLTVPLLSDEHISQLKTLAALHISVNTVSWAVVNCQKKELITWGVTDLQPPSGKNNLHSLLTLASDVLSKLPDADVYIFEDINWSNMTGSQLSVKIHICRAQLTAMFVTLIENLGKHQNSVNCPKAVFLKSRLTSQLFRRNVGSERVSTQRVVEDILQQRLNGHHSNVFIGPLVKSVFFEHRGHQKESLCEPLLLNIAFMDLVIFKRTDLLQLSKKSKKQKTASVSSSPEEGL